MLLSLCEFVCMCALEYEWDLHFMNHLHDDKVHERLFRKSVSASAIFKWTSECCLSIIFPLLPIQSIKKVTSLVLPRSKISHCPVSTQNQNNGGVTINGRKFHSYAYTKNYDVRVSDVIYFITKPTLCFKPSKLLH